MTFSPDQKLKLIFWRESLIVDTFPDDLTVLNDNLTTLIVIKKKSLFKVVHADHRIMPSIN